MLEISPDKCIHLRNLIFIITITTASLVIGFYPTLGGAALFGPVRCKGNDKMVCVNSCYMGCINSTRSRNLPLNISGSPTICEYTNNGCYKTKDSVNCVFQILNYYYMNITDSCLETGCYNGSVCLSGDVVLPKYIYGLMSGFKGTVWGVILVLFGVIFFVGSTFIFLRIIYNNYTKVNYGPMQVNFLGERTDLISPTNNQIKRYEPIVYKKLTMKK